MNDFVQGFNDGLAAGQSGDVDGMVLLFTLAFLVGFIFGAIKTFRRNWILAFLMLVFLFPIWALWAFVEIFTGKIAPKVHYVEVTNKSA